MAPTTMPRRPTPTNDSVLFIAPPLIAAFMLRNRHATLNWKPRRMIHHTAAVLILVCLVASPNARAESIASETISLRYEEKLVALGFPSPLLRATVGGQSAWFLIDTGASVHTLASWLVSAAHLSTRETTATVTGSTGMGKPVRAVANQAILLEGGRLLELREAIVVEFPTNFATNKIGGLLSPQLLATGSDASVLDLRVPALRFDAFDS